MLKTVESKLSWKLTDRKLKMTDSNNQPQKSKPCGCGRSPTGQCIGWHILSENVYLIKLEEYETMREDVNGDKV